MTSLSSLKDHQHSMFIQFFFSPFTALTKVFSAFFFYVRFSTNLNLLASLTHFIIYAVLKCKVAAFDCSYSTFLMEVSGNHGGQVTISCTECKGTGHNCRSCCKGQIYKTSVASHPNEFQGASWKTAQTWQKLTEHWVRKEK